jgi:hypothetical protein
MNKRHTNKMRANSNDIKLKKKRSTLKKTKKITGGEIYTGEYDTKDRKDGHGQLIYDVTGSVAYDGTWYINKRYGQGTMTYTTTDTDTNEKKTCSPNFKFASYKGEWKLNKPTTTKSRWIYREGEWKYNTTTPVVGEYAPAFFVIHYTDETKKLKNIATQLIYITKLNEEVNNIMEKDEIYLEGTGRVDTIDNNHNTSITNGPFTVKYERKVGECNINVTNENQSILGSTASFFNNLSKKYTKNKEGRKAEKKKKKLEELMKDSRESALLKMNRDRVKAYEESRPRYTFVSASGNPDTRIRETRESESV